VRSMRSNRHKEKETAFSEDAADYSTGKTVHYRIIHGDNRNFLKEMAVASAQLIVTSPPYNIGKVYEKGRRIGLDDYLSEQLEVIGRPGGSICWQIGNHIAPNGEVIPLDLELYSIFRKFPDLKLRNRIIWTFGHGLHAKKRLSGRYETILWFVKPDDSGEYYFDVNPIRVPQKYPSKRFFKGPRVGKISGNPLGKNPGDVWAIPNVKANHIEKTIHPCQFPVELIERLVLSLTKPGDLVVDPYLGVGSTAVAAVKHGRNAAGCDIEKAYIEVARERVEKMLRGDLITRPMGKPVYEPDKKNKLTWRPIEWKGLARAGE
jgi:adenine-specific DNA-methyltransferase